MRDEAGGSDAAFERAKLELRVEELTVPLSATTSRATALHDCLSRVSEDRNVLEMNLSGERGANELNQRVIGELRREVEQLKADAVRSGEGKARL